MLQIQIDEDMPEHVHITDTADSRVKKRIHLGLREKKMIESLFAQAKGMLQS